MNEFSPLAVIDIGSNSIRLVIFDCKKKFAIPIFNEKTQCGLGSDLSISKRLSNESCLKANKAIERKTGARGLRSIMEAILLESMYDLPSIDDVEEIVINSEVVEGRAQPLQIYSDRREELNTSA